MPLTELTDKIVEDAREKAQGILTGAQEEAAGIIEEGRRQVEQILSEGDADSERVLADNIRKVSASASQEARKLTEEARLAALDDIFEKTKKRIAGLPASEYVTLFTRILSGHTIPTDEKALQVYAPQSRMTETKQILKAVGLTGTMLEGAFESGLVIASDSAEYTFSLDALLSRVRERYEIDIARLLFTERSK